ncbi:MAG TPA: ABC transporter substrate-binding protein [Candidatus Angelobacter sp.]|nr:ABC transporter substrate-binding protein [Candidatus Angelobacter sp.]
MRTRALLIWFVLFCASTVFGQSGGELRFCLRSDPKTFNPLLVNDESSETVRYLTAGFLLRVNRITQQPEPELATSWKVFDGGRSIRFKLRPGVRYSDGTPFSAADVTYTMEKLLDPSIHSSTSDAFRSGKGKLATRVLSPTDIELTFPAPIANLANLFDGVPIISSSSPQKEMAALGPFFVAEHKAGAFVLLKRNPNYWKKDSQGRQLPYLDSVRLEIEQNPDIEAMKYERGEIDLINTVSPAIYDKLARVNASLVRDAGPSTDTEELWFNEVPAAPIPAYKKQWFASTAFRQAISESINREDMSRLVFHGHAVPAVSNVPQSNKFWFNQALRPHRFDTAEALRRLQADGFRLENQQLRDKNGNAVEFSIVTNAGNRSREQMATMIQQDLKQIGIEVSVVTLDFNSLLERMTQTFNYDACLLGTVNGDLDPSSQMTMWLSSGEDHIWNPKEKTPATGWEAEIDKQMRIEASTLDFNKRKAAWDRVQKIAWEQQPVIYLLNKDSLVAISPQIKNAQPSPFRPQTYWNIEDLMLARR